MSYAVQAQSKIMQTIWDGTRECCYGFELLPNTKNQDVDLAVIFLPGSQLSMSSRVTENTIYSLSVPLIALILRLLLVNIIINNPV